MRATCADRAAAPALGGRRRRSRPERINSWARSRRRLAPGAGFSCIVACFDLTHRHAREVKARLPSAPIERGRPGRRGLLAHVLVNKYADHLPLYRKARYSNREGWNLDRLRWLTWVRQIDCFCGAGWPNAIGRHVLAGQAISLPDGTSGRDALATGTGKDPRRRGFGLTAAMMSAHGGSAIPPASWLSSSRSDRKGEQTRRITVANNRRPEMHADGYAGFEDL